MPCGNSLSRFVVANSLFLAAPTQIIAAIYGLAASGELWPHVGISAAEFALGYVIASLLGIALGFAMASSEVVKKMLQPWISGLYATPTIALAPLFILWLGIGIWSKVVVVIFLVLFPVTINTEAGLRTTSPRLIEMLRSFGATPRQIFFKLSLPSAMPFILAGLKLGIGRGLIGVVVAELFGSRAGLGRLISQSADAFNMPELFAGVVILAVAGIVMTAGFTWLERVARAVDAGLTRNDGIGSMAPKLALDAAQQALRRSRSAARHQCRDRPRRVHLAGRPERLRQDHAAAHRRRALSRQAPARCCSTAAPCARPGGDRGFVFQSDNLLPWRTVLRQRASSAPRSPAAPAPRSEPHRANCCGSSASKASRAISRASFPAACASASISRARSPSIRKSC